MNQSGYTFISLLISLVIIGILASVALVHYQSMGLFQNDRTDSESFVRRLDKNLAMDSLKKLHLMEIAYQTRFNRYATFDELSKEGFIPAGYTADLQEHGVPYLDYWDIEINADEETYVLLAIPNSKALDFDNVPILAMNETGRIWEEEGLDESLVDGPDESSEEEEIPFPFSESGE